MCAAFESEVCVSTRSNVLSHLPALMVPEGLSSKGHDTLPAVPLHSHCCCSSIWELAQESVGIGGLIVR